MQETVEFYRDILELEINYPDKEDYSEEMWVTFKTGACTLAIHGGSQENYGKDAPKFKFDVDDVEETKKLLEEKGVMSGKIVEAYPGSFVCDFKDPAGNIFFIQSHPSHH